MAITWRVPLLMLAGIVPVVLWPAGSTAAVWILLVIVLVLLDVLIAPKPASLEIRRTQLGGIRLGDEAASELIIRSPARSVRALIRDAWQPTAGAGSTTSGSASATNRHRIRLGLGDSTRLRTPLRPRRRGDLHALGVTVRAYGPLGLGARQRTLQVEGAVRVLPAFESRKHLPSRLQRLRELDGRAAVRVRGQGTEFDSLREYVRGDDVRSIDWRTTARSRTVVVRTWQPERDRRVVLVLDTSRTSAARVEGAGGGVPRLDSAMDAGLLLAAIASRAGDRIDFLGGDQRVRSRLRLAGQRDVTQRLQETMADLEPVIAEADWSTLAGAVAGLGRHRALVVLLTPLDPHAIEESLLPVLPVLTQHHRVVLASVRDPELEATAASRDTLDDVYAAAAAEQTLRRRDHTAAMLRALGVDIVDADAESLPPALADHYLQLKATGQL
ncbi:uncharacterized protein (DUF58 family) [Nocardioides albertanoniae]|uniref:Uncharacterized protein (DUF58 family) n=1 Tax=Nocardioides albertanoniae TaxID=1175486 RepID=A0A543A3E9_9ACTN|nr:DUF58 domain-containing protein [Nocardioides albertanoniae]TQL67115.1 uncharacterized protein (DUF58 family) [Nocardioides albertanoniae]